MGVVWRAQRGLVRVVRWALEFPLRYKILIANAALAAAATLAGSWLVTRYASASTEGQVRWEFAMAYGTVVVAAVVLVNYAIIRAALQPISALTRLVVALQRGEAHVRAQRPLFCDRESALLIGTTNDLLDQLAAYQSRVQEMSRQVTEQLETERKNVARELHDDTAQSLAALLALEQMVAKASNDDERAQAIEEARQLTRLILEGVRRMSIGLRPAILDDAGLQATLRWYVEELMGSVLPDAKLDLDDFRERLPPAVEIALYRIAQEALSNVARHAQASQVSLSLKRESDHIVLQVADDGLGFELDVPPLASREHLGLFTIQERARLVGGEAEVRSQPGKGATVVVRIPLGQKLAGSKGSQ